MRRHLIGLLAACAVVLVPSTAAQAIVVTVGNAGPVGAALVPSTLGYLSAHNITPVTSSTACTDPALAADLGGPNLPAGDLCYRGGPVLHQNETFDLTWDPLRRYWLGTRGFVETFLQDVAKGSKTLTSPYAVAGQYQDGTGRAANVSLYGGGCINYGVIGGSACQFGATTDTFAQGEDYLGNGCSPTGYNQFGSGVSAGGSLVPNDVCLTDGQIQGEISKMVNEFGIGSRVQSGYSPVIMLMTPPGVVDCIDSTGNLCSANSTITPPIPTLNALTAGGDLSPGDYQVAETYDLNGTETITGPDQTVTVTDPSSSNPTASVQVSAPPAITGASGWYFYVAPPGSQVFYRESGLLPFPASGHGFTTFDNFDPTGAQPPVDTVPSFCSYHSQVLVPTAAGPIMFRYVVQPWTALSGVGLCDEPDAPKIPDPPTAAQLSSAIGQRLVSPLSQGQIAAMTDPGSDGWVSNAGYEINDNGCAPLAKGLDLVSVGPDSYYLQREFNNAGLIAKDPFSETCMPDVVLDAQFVPPSTVDSGKAVAFDGSISPTSLLIPYAGYSWNFGDGTSTAPQATGPSVTHVYRYGGSYTVTLAVVDRGGDVQTVSHTLTVDGPPPPSQSSGSLVARLQLTPQSLRSVLSGGLSVRLTSNQAADAVATISIPRSAARKAKISGPGSDVVVGRGTVSGVPAGTSNYRLHINPTVRRKLAGLKHAKLIVSILLIGSDRHQLAVKASGQY